MAAADGYRAILVESAMVTEGLKIKLQRLAFQQPGTGNIVDDQMGKIRLARNGQSEVTLRHPKRATQVVSGCGLGTRSRIALSGEAATRTSWPRSLTSGLAERRLDMRNLRQLF